MLTVAPGSRAVPLSETIFKSFNAQDLSPWRGLTPGTGIWVCKRVLILFFTSIQASEILFDQYRERPEFSQCDVFGDSYLIGTTPCNSPVYG